MNTGSIGAVADSAKNWLKMREINDIFRHRNDLQALALLSELSDRIERDFWVNAHEAIEGHFLVEPFLKKSE